MRFEELSKKLEELIREAVQDEIKRYLKEKSIVVSEKELFEIITEWMYYRHQYRDLEEYIKKIMEGYK